MSPPLATAAASALLLSSSTITTAAAADTLTPLAKNIFAQNWERERRLGTLDKAGRFARSFVIASRNSNFVVVVVSVSRTAAACAVRPKFAKRGKS